MKKEMHGRDYAVSVYNEFCDIIGLKESKRIKCSLSVEEKKEYKEELDENLITKKEYEELLEESDTGREMILRAIQEGKLELEEFNNEKKLVFNLYEPILRQDSKEVELGKLVFENRYKLKDQKPYTRGLKENDQTGQQIAMIAMRTRQPKALIENLFDKDSMICMMVINLFMTALM